MTKEDLINDMSFRQKCGQYGLDWKEDIIGISKDAILLNKAGDVVVLFDKNYNTISIESNVELSSIEEIDYYMEKNIKNIVDLLILCLLEKTLDIRLKNIH